MTEATKTVAFRVSQDIEEQIQEMAKASGQRKSEWVRALVMQALHVATPASLAAPSTPPESKELAAEVPAIEVRLCELETALRQEITSVKSAIDVAVGTHHEDLCLFVKAAREIHAWVEKRVATASEDVLGAIENLKKAQRSHKDTLLHAMDQAPRHKPGRC